MKTIFVVAAHPDDEVLGCGGTLLKHVHDGDKVYILFISDGVSGRFKEKDSDKCLKEISNREIMARKVSSLGKFKIVDFLKDSGITLGRGVVVNSFLETNLPDIYAIGDCAEQTQPQINRRPIEAVWYTGRIMGETLANTLCGKREQYQPNHWFNSAKFFDIEYQTYGRVEAKPDPTDQKQFYWQHQSKNQLLRLSYHPETEITITSGATQAIYSAITAFIKPDDEVIVFRPAYDSYVPSVELCGGKVVSIQMKHPEYGIDWNEVKTNITSKTKMAKVLKQNKEKTVNFIKENVKRGKKIFIYGASTKGNTLLQYYGLTNKEIPFAAERTKTKWGKYTIGSGVKILSEEKARKLKPDYFFVMPYGFINEFLIFIPLG